jgi:hypothetical protein
MIDLRHKLNIESRRKLTMDPREKSDHTRIDKGEHDLLGLLTHLLTKSRDLLPNDLLSTPTPAPIGVAGKGRVLIESELGSEDAPDAPDAPDFEDAPDSNDGDGMERGLNKEQLQFVSVRGPCYLQP